MAFDAGAVIAHVGMDTKGFEKGAGFVKSQVGSLMKGFSVLAAANLFKNIIKETDEFRKSLSNVSTLVDTSVVSMDNFKSGILSMAGTLGSAKDLTEGLYQAISASVDPAKALEFVAESAKFAKAALVDTNTAVDVITTGLNAYGMSAEKATMISDQLFSVIKLGKTTGTELSAVIGQSIPLAANMGIAFDQLGASIAIMTRQGISASEATTQFNAVVTSFLKPSEKLAATIKKLGYESGSAAIDQLGFKKALDLVVDSAGGSNEQLAEMFNNSRALRGVIALSGEGAKDFGAVLDEITNSAGATNTAFGKQEKTFEDLQNTINKTMIVVGEKMIPVIYELATSFTTFFEELSKNESVLWAFEAAAQAIGWTLKAAMGIIQAITHDSMAWAKEQKTLSSNIKATGIALQETAKSVEDWKKAIAGAFSVEEKRKLSLKEAQAALKVYDKQIEEAVIGLKKYTDQQDIIKNGTLDLNAALDSSGVSTQKSAESKEKEKDALNQLIAARELLLENIQLIRIGEGEEALRRQKMQQEFAEMTADQTILEIAEIKRRQAAYIEAGVKRVDAEKWAAAQIAEINKDAIEAEAQREAERVQQEKEIRDSKIQQVQQQQDEINALKEKAHNAELKRIADEKAAHEALMQSLYNTSMAMYGGLQGLSGAYYDYQLSKYDEDSAEYKKAKEEQFTVNKVFNAINAGIAGATGAVEAYKALAGIPIVGPALGIAAAATLGAFAAAQVGFIMAQEMPAMEHGGVGRGLAIVGEAGPEIVNLGSTSRVIPADETADLLGRSSGTTMNNTYYVNNQTDAELVSRKVAQRMRSAERRS